MKKKAQHYIDTESTEKLVWTVILIIFPEYLSFHQEEYYLNFLLLSFTMDFQKFHIIGFLKSKKKSV